MIKPLLALLVVASITAISAPSTQAKTLKVTSDDATVATVDIPDSWKPEEIEDGVEAQSSDDAVYLAIVAVGNEKGMNAEIDDTFEMLKKHNVVIDDKSKKENKFKINGIEAQELLFQGKDEDGPAGISICFVPMKDKMIIMTYWVTTAKEAAHQQEVGKIVNSLKPAA